MAQIEFAHVESASATWGDGTLTIQANGSVPSTCWRPEIQLAPIDIFPPEFNAVRVRTPGVCLPVVTRFVLQESFPLGTGPKSIELHAADQDGNPKTFTLEVGPAEEGPAPTTGDDAEYDEAFGRSRGRLAFDEAFADAVANLPPVEPPSPDHLETVEVVSTHAEFGGIAGFHDLVVRVRRPRLPT